MNKVLVYGAYGYTGRLIVDELLKKGIQPVVAGRDEDKTRAFADSHDLSHLIFEVDEREKILKALSGIEVLIHCAGPFVHTAQEMVEACLATNTHYLDITGEYQVFDLVQKYDELAKEKGIMLMPGAGFDVVPSDCLAKKLHKCMPDATDLKLAFMSKGGRLSRGTTKTMIENLGDPQVIRKNGEYAYELMGNSTRMVNFGDFENLTMGITWGDISTAFRSTGIPNIEVFSGTTEEQLSKVRKIGKFSFLLKSKLVKTFLKGKLDRKPDGPSSENREESKMYLWGQVSNGAKVVEARLHTPNGYTLTAKTSVLITRKIMSGDFRSGYQTPSEAYGEDLITEVEGCHWVD
ncbi:MAG: saccharopine dehydrogenase NADP-binding domain-containing protein [Ekhidna sp.]